MKYYDKLSFIEIKIKYILKVGIFLCLLSQLNCQDTEALIYMYMNYLS